MKNPINKQCISVYALTNKGKTVEWSDRRIVVSYGRSNSVCAFDGYSDHVLGRANGGGYDKTNSALGIACEKIIGEKLNCDGAAGFANVERACAAHGWTLTKIV